LLRTYIYIYNLTRNKHTRRRDNIIYYNVRFATRVQTSDGCENALAARWRRRAEIYAPKRAERFYSNDFISDVWPGWCKFKLGASAASCGGGGFARPCTAYYIVLCNTAAADVYHIRLLHRRACTIIIYNADDDDERNCCICPMDPRQLCARFKRAHAV